ncbi:MAG: flagellar filament capping protein FliD, partial [Candidatus Eremiobacteraeota bacterium]|nr:flagellar filament capping protein FliD [Candidatus Eremiobacteraeota bacterium]
GNYHPSTAVGSQAAVTYQDASGATRTAYSNSNQVTNVIPGVQLNLTAADAATPFTVTVAQDTTNLTNAINGFVTAYNNAITEINSATAAPIVSGNQPGSGSDATQLAPGGVLWQNPDVLSLKDKLVNLVSGMVSNNGTSFNSLASIGLQLTNSFAEITAGSSGQNSDSSSSNAASQLTTTTFSGTDGQLQPLDATALQSALSADPQAVQNLFDSSQGILAQLGTYLTFATGTPSQLGPNGSFLATVPDTSLISGFETDNTNQIDSLNQQIQLVQNQANQQADLLRQEFVQSETLIAQYQSIQSSLGALTASFNTSSGH